VWYNPIMTWLLKSPLHGLVSGNMLLVSIRGRKSGKMVSTPTNYLRVGNTLWIISWRTRDWWKNLRGGGPVRLLLAGKSVEGRGQVLEEQKTVASGLRDYYERVPQAAKYVRIGLDSARRPVLTDCERAARDMVMVRIDLI
jgi:hypothetical protein